MQSYEYDTISEAKATGNLDEAEVEAEASTQMLRINLKSIKCLHLYKGSSLAKKSFHIHFVILFWTLMIKYK